MFLEVAANPLICFYGKNRDIAGMHAIHGEKFSHWRASAWRWRFLVNVDVPGGELKRIDPQARMYCSCDAMATVADDAAASLKPMARIQRAVYVTS